MAKLGQAFDSSKHDDMDNFDPIPAGWYPCIMKGSELKVTKDKTGQYLECKFEVIQGDYKGRFIWSRLNLKNRNPVAVEIAQKELATICRSCGKGVIQDSQELHGIPLQVKVKIKPETDSYPAGNETVGYKAIGGNDPEPDFTGDEGSITGDEESWNDAPDEEAEVGGDEDPPWQTDDDIPF